MEDDCISNNDFEESGGWVCDSCGLFNADDYHCLSCGRCPPNGCGMDHQDDDFLAGEPA